MCYILVIRIPKKVALILGKFKPLYPQSTFFSIWFSHYWGSYTLILGNIPLKLLEFENPQGPLQPERGAAARRLAGAMR